MLNLHRPEAPCVSVVIPAHNESRWIASTLRAVLGQETRHGPFEVIVVDADSSDDTCRIAEGFPVTLLRSGQRASYVARNLGYARARADRVAFLDADCIPDEGWLDAMLGCANDGADYVAGRIENTIAVDNVANRVLALRTAADVRKQAALEGKVAAGNMLVRREVFDRIGPFEPVASGADIRQSGRAIANGFRLGYVETAVVRHQCDLGTLDYLRRRYRIKRGQAASSATWVRLAVSAILQALRPGLGEAARTSRRVGQPLANVWLMLWAERWAECLGWLAGAAARWPKSIPATEGRA